MLRMHLLRFSDTFVPKYICYFVLVPLDAYTYAAYMVRYLIVYATLCVFLCDNSSSHRSATLGCSKSLNYVVFPFQEGSGDHAAGAVQDWHSAAAGLLPENYATSTRVGDNIFISDDFIFFSIGRTALCPHALYRRKLCVPIYTD